MQPPNPQTPLEVEDKTKLCEPLYMLVPATRMNPQKTPRERDNNEKIGIAAVPAASMRSRSARP